MSLILEALRKMEQDRARRRGAQVDIRPEVLRYRGAAGPQRSWPWLPVLVGVVLLAGGVGAGLLIKGNRIAGDGAAGEQAGAAGGPARQAAVGNVGAQQTAGPERPPGTSRTEETPRTSTATPMRTPELPGTAGSQAPGAGRTLTPEGGRVAAQAPVAAARALPAKQPVAVAPRARSLAEPPHQQRAVPREVVAPLPAPTDIALSGIAWQDERGLRRAVLNGALVGEGAEVAGARVAEIREDRVRLSRGGQSFEVMLSSAGR